jgi:NAD(P)H-dependent flavin oxidoreductase YrpB (nitropropane dioxygenase family)
MFGSAARDAVNFTARLVREAGGGEINTLTLAYWPNRFGRTGADVLQCAGHDQGGHGGALAAIQKRAMPEGG